MEDAISLKSAEGFLTFPNWMVFRVVLVTKHEIERECAKIASQLRHVFLDAVVERQRYA